MASFMVRPPGTSKSKAVELSWTDVNNMTLEQMLWWVKYIGDLRQAEQGPAVS